MAWVLLARAGDTRMLLHRKGPCGLGREREARREEREGEDCRKGGLPSTHLPEVPPPQEEPAEPDKGPAGARGGFPHKGS